MMRISSIELWHVRGIDHLLLEGLLAQGVSVIHGPNEEGKSTIVAAVLAALTYKYSSKAADVQSLASVGKTDPPRVLIHGTIDGHSFIIDKQWLRRPHAKVSVGLDARVGDEAEQLLVSGIKEAMDMDLMTALMSLQGGGKKPVTASAVPTLTRALHAASEQEEDAGLDAAGDSTLLDLAAAEYQRSYTATGKEKDAGELGTARAALGAAQQAAEQAAAEVRRLEAVVEEVMGLEQRLAAAQEDLPRYSEQYQASEADYHKIEELEHKLAELTSREKNLKGQVDLAAMALDTATRVVGRLAESEAHLKALQAEEPALVAAAKEEETATAAARQAYEAAVAEEQAAEKALGTARECRVLAERAAQVEKNRGLVSELDEIDQEMARLQAICVVADPDLEAATAAAQEAAVGRAALVAAAAQVSMSAPAGTAVTVDGEQVALGEQAQQWHATQELHIQVGEVTLVITPPGNQEDRHAEIGRHEDSLSSLCQRYGCADLEELRQAHRQGVAAQEQLRILRTTRALTLGENVEDQLRAQVGAADTDVPALSLKEATAQEEQARLALEAARQATDETQQQVMVRQHTPVALELHRLKVRIDTATEQTNALRVEHEQLGEDAIAQRQEALASAQAAWQQAAADRVTLSEEVAAQDGQAKKTLVDSLAAKVENTTALIARLREDIAANRSAIDQATGAGQRHQEAQQALAQAQRAFDSVQRRAHAARLLYDTLRAAREETVNRYAAPFVEQLGAIARIVFGPTALLEVDSNLAVTHRTLEGERLPVAALSAGAQEQVELITRLAMARLVSVNESGGVPVFLDDILSVSDAGRVDAIAAVLSNLSAQEQILVFTCVPERMAGVVGVREYPMATLKSTRGM